MNLGYLQINWYFRGTLNFKSAYLRLKLQAPKNIDFRRMFSTVIYGVIMCEKKWWVRFYTIFLASSLKRLWNVHFSKKKRSYFPNNAITKSNKNYPSDYIKIFLILKVLYSHPCLSYLYRSHRYSWTVLFIWPMYNWYMPVTTLAMHNVIRMSRKPISSMSKVS